MRPPPRPIELLLGVALAYGTLANRIGRWDGPEGVSAMAVAHIGRPIVYWSLACALVVWCGRSLWRFRASRSPTSKAWAVQDCALCGFVLLGHVFTTLRFTLPVLVIERARFDGSPEFALIHRVDLFSGDVGLGVKSGSSWWSERFLIAGVWYRDDDDMTHPAMIRRAGGGREWIVQGPDGTVLAVRSALCFGGWDVKEGRRMDLTELNRLSPFALLREGDVPSDDDMAATFDRVVRARQWLTSQDQATRERGFDAVPTDLFGRLPSESALIDAFRSSNPVIVDIANRIAVAGGTTGYPTAGGADRNR